MGLEQSQLDPAHRWPGGRGWWWLGGRPAPAAVFVDFRVGLAQFHPVEEQLMPDSWPAGFQHADHTSGQPAGGLGLVGGLLPAQSAVGALQRQDPSAPGALSVSAGILMTQHRAR